MTRQAVLSVERVEAGSVKPRARDVHRGDRLFARSLRALAFALALLLLIVAAFLARAAWPALSSQGARFLTTSTWDPVRDIYGAIPVIFGTVVSSLMALLIATPLSLGVALFLTEIAPRRLGRAVGLAVEMLAAIPSVVYGLWGIFVLAPLLRTYVEPFLARWLGFLPIFKGPVYGVGMLAAGLILAVMITPTISSIAREVFQAIPRVQREAAFALGATRWEMIRLSVLPSARRGVVGAVILGLGRALGETMAVTMVIGNRHEIAASLFAPSSTMASIIANEYAEATSELHTAALVEVGLVLFFVTFLINLAARLLLSGVLGRTRRGA